MNLMLLVSFILFSGLGARAEKCDPSKIPLGNISFHLSGLSEPATAAFKADFIRFRDKLNAYWAETNFAKVYTGDYEVIVSQEIKPGTESIIHAWNGDLGKLTFASSRAEFSQVSFIHELTLFAGNGSRFLAEGLAVRNESNPKLGWNKGYPMLGLPIYNLINHPALRLVRLRVLDQIPTPEKLDDPVNLGAAIPNPVERARFIYAVAGTFVKFLIEKKKDGLCKFKKLYEFTPFVPGISKVPDVNRYQRVYRGSIDQLQTEWLAWLAGGGAAIASPKPIFCK